MIKSKYKHTNIVAADWRKLAGFYQQVFGCEPVPPERAATGPWRLDPAPLGTLRCEGAASPEMAPFDGIPHVAFGSAHLCTCGADKGRDIGGQVPGSRAITLSARCRRTRRSSLRSAVVSAVYTACSRPSKPHLPITPHWFAVATTGANASEAPHDAPAPRRT